MLPTRILLRHLISGPKFLKTLKTASRFLTRDSASSRFARFALRSKTSKFDATDMHLLNIRITPTNTPTELFPLGQMGQEHEYLMLDGVNRSEILSMDIARDTRYTIAQKTLLDNLRRCVINEESRGGDGLAGWFMYNLGFNAFPLYLGVQPRYEYRGRDIHIRAKPDYSIERDGQVLFVDEDKHKKSAPSSSKMGEYQLAGEMLVSTLSKDPSGDVIVYGMRVYNTRFSFYRGYIPESYYLGLGARSLPMKESMGVIRYPSKPATKDRISGMSLDYADPQERSVIVQCLLGLKDRLLA